VLQTGDLIRVRLRARDVYLQVVAVAAAEPRTPTERPARAATERSSSQRVRLSPPLLALRHGAALLKHSGTVELLSTGADPVPVEAKLLPRPGQQEVDGELCMSRPVSLRVTRSGSRQLPTPGDWLRLTGWVSEPDAWVGVERVELAERSVAGSVVTYAATVHGRVVLPQRVRSWRLPSKPVLERVTLDVHARAAGRTSRLVGLGLLPAHPRYVVSLPDLAGRLAPEPDMHPARPAFDDLAGSPFPWAGDADGTSAPKLVPVLVDEAIATWVRPVPMEGTPLEQDGLGAPDALALVDALLIDQGVETLVQRAEELRWRTPKPHRLRGIHALLGVDEVTVVAVPDAAQVGWEPVQPPEQVEPPPSEQPEPAAGCDHGDFDDCATRPVPPAPRWEPALGLGEELLLAWTLEPFGDPAGGSAGREPVFRLEESVAPTGWTEARVVHLGPEREAFVPATSLIPRYFRVRAEVAGQPGLWSEGLGLPESAGHDYVAPADYEPAVLLDVQRTLLRACAARGDLLAVLSVPEHYRAPAVAAHVAALTTPASAPGPRNVVVPLGPWETGVLGYGALYHPWLVHGTPDTAVSSAPDGAVAGVLAARARTRGAWVAPANERLHDVVALAHDEPRASQQLLRGSQANAVVRSRESFLWLSEDTLTADPDLRPVNVRRLHSLVRRVVLLEGPHYVFEPNDHVLRRGIERGFVELMRFLHSLGAFAGHTAAEAFRVTVGDVNTPASIDAGRLIVEIAYAPSRPLEFLLVRLVHAGEPGFRLVES
jgi:hypothetical protein